MIGRWLGYGIFLLAAAYAAVIYKDTAVSMLFVAALLFLTGSIITLWIRRRGTRVELQIPVPVAEKEKPVQVQIHVSDGRYLFTGPLTICMSCTSYFTGQKEKYMLTLDQDSKHQNVNIYEIFGNSCGKMSVNIDRIQIWDYFHFLGLTKKAALSREITFLPQIYETSVVVSEAVRHFAGETEEDEPEAAGNDHSQIYQIRPYRPGDRIQRIHWKMTARNDEIYVREDGEPICLAVGIFLDFYAPFEALKRDMEALIEAGLSISNELLEQKCAHFIVWYDLRGKRLCKQRIMKVEDIYEVMGYLVSAACSKEEVDIKTMYQELFPYGLYAVDISLKLNGDICVAENKVACFDPEDIKHSMSECEICI